MNHTYAHIHYDIFFLSMYVKSEIFSIVRKSRVLGSVRIRRPDKRQQIESVEI